MSLKKKARSASKTEAGSLAHIIIIKEKKKKKRILDGPISLTICPSLPRGLATLIFSPFLLYRSSSIKSGNNKAVTKDILVQIYLATTNCALAAPSFLM